MFALLALVAWTLYVWGTRITNALGDADLGGGSLVVALALAGAMVGLAVWLGVQTVRRRDVRSPLLAVTVATVAMWAVRVPLILAHDHSGGFKVVHVGLAVVSLALVANSWRVLRRRSPVAVA